MKLEASQRLVHKAWPLAADLLLLATTDLDLVMGRRQPQLQVPRQ